MDKVYAFLYNPCIHESSWGTVSLHKTRRGAEMALEFHKAEQKREWDYIYKGEEPPFEFGAMESWIVEEIDIAD